MSVTTMLSGSASRRALEPVLTALSRGGPFPTLWVPGPERPTRGGVTVVRVAAVGRSGAAGQEAGDAQQAAVGLRTAVRAVGPAGRPGR